MRLHAFLRAAIVAAFVLVAAWPGIAQRYEWGGAEAGGRFMTTDTVSADSLETMVRWLSEDTVVTVINGDSLRLRSRFTFREADLMLVADTLVSRLVRYTGGTAQRIPFTIVDSKYSNDSTFTAENLAVRFSGTGAVDGLVLVTGHYDAIASREDGWSDNWETWPAPGADDNGTGVAAVLEVARVLAASPRPFDVLFVFFSAEELGLLGSRDFVDRFRDFYDEDILAVLNIDMIGYRALDEPGVSVVSDYRSGWLADLVEALDGEIDTGLEVDIRNPGPANSDHTPFWWAHIPAISYIQPLVGSGHITNPAYHSLGDTISWVDFEQTHLIARLALDFLGYLSQSEPEAALLPSDLMLMRRNTVTGRRVFNAGDTLTVWARPRNISSADIPAQGTIWLKVELYNANGTRILYDGSVQPPPPLKALQGLRFPLYLEEGMKGENRVRASISVTGFDDDPSNNEASVNYGVEGGTDILLGHSFQPNPIRSSFQSAQFCLHLAAEGNFKVEVFSLTGERIGQGRIGSQYGRPVSAGLNCFGCGELFPEAGNLVSGIYLYRLVEYDEGGASKKYTSRFAIEN
jgi:hypothetical protein